MATSVDTAFITQYEADVKEVFQRKGSYLINAVFHRPDVIGSTCVFPRIGVGVATTKARHGTITPMNQTHASPSASLADFYAGDWQDKFDQSKTNIDLRKVYASGGAMALGRKVDDQITTILDTTAATVITLTVTSKATVLATALQFAEAAWSADVPNDGEVYAVVTSRYYSQLMTIDGFSRAAFVGFDGLPFREGPMIGLGKWKDWMGIKWKLQTGMPSAGTSSAKCWIWHKTAVGYASAAAAGNIAGNAMVSADITWHGDRASWFINHGMSGGAVLIDGTGVIEGTLDDTAAIVTS